MLYRFKSQATEDVVMMEGNARQLLDIVGKASSKGIITVDQLPAAIAAGLPPLAGAVAIAIAGQGMALSSDYVIGVAPGISAKAAGAVASVVADRALVLSLITGSVALLIGPLQALSDRAAGSLF